MALKERIDSLKKRHAQIDRKIMAETSRPVPDAGLLHQLKAQKLQLKDDLHRLLDGEAAAA